MRFPLLDCRRILLALLVVLSAAAGADAAPARINILFLGDNGHHRPAERFRQLAPVMKKQGIDLTYTDKVADLNAATLARYDGLMIYANIEKIAPEQEKALLDYVENGKGFIPLHCAIVLLPQLAEIHRPRRGAVPQPWHRHLPHHHRRA